MSMALSEKVLIICNEQSSKVWKMNMLLFILYKYYHYTDITKNKLMSGTFKNNPKQVEMINKAKDYFNEHYKEFILYNYQKIILMLLNLKLDIMLSNLVMGSLFLTR